MSALDFIVNLVRAAAWPLFGCFAVFVLRNPVRSFLGELSRTVDRMRAKAGPVELEIQRTFAESSKAIAAVAVVSNTVGDYPIPALPMGFQHIEEMRNDPYGTIVECYNELLVVFRNALIDEGVKVPLAVTNLVKLAEVGRDHGLFDITAPAKEIDDIRSEIDMAISANMSWPTVAMFDSFLHGIFLVQVTEYGKKSKATTQAIQ